MWARSTNFVINEPEGLNRDDQEKRNSERLHAFTILMKYK